MQYAKDISLTWNPGSFMQSLIMHNYAKCKGEKNLNEVSQLSSGQGLLYFSQGKPVEVHQEPLFSTNAVNLKLTMKNTSSCWFCNYTEFKIWKQDKIDIKPLSIIQDKI